MMRQRPVTYKDWRKLYQVECFELGREVRWLFNGRSILVDRTFYKRIRRLERIRARIDVENQVRDQTWYDALYEMLSSFTRD